MNMLPFGVLTLRKLYVCVVKKQNSHLLIVVTIAANVVFVFCGPCSEKRFLLPSQSSKPVRICDFCYDLLSTGDRATCQPARSDSQSLKPPLNDESDDDDDDSSD